MLTPDVDWVGCRVRSIRFDIDCPSCGQAVLTVTAHGVSNGVAAPLVVRCAPCRSSWLVRAELLRVGTTVGPELP